MIDLETSPFEEPTYECRDCGRTDEHTYCIRWMERLYLWFSRERRRNGEAAQPTKGTGS